MYLVLALLFVLGTAPSRSLDNFHPARHDWVSKFARVRDPVTLADPPLRKRFSITLRIEIQNLFQVILNAAVHTVIRMSSPSEVEIICLFWVSQHVDLGTMVLTNAGSSDSSHTHFHPNSPPTCKQTTKRPALSVRSNPTLRTQVPAIQ